MATTESMAEMRKQLRVECALRIASRFNRPAIMLIADDVLSVLDALDVAEEALNVLILRQEFHLPRLGGVPMINPEGHREDCISCRIRYEYRQLAEAALARLGGES